MGSRREETEDEDTEKNGRLLTERRALGALTMQKIKMRQSRP